MSATSSTMRRALWPHPYGEMFEDASRKPPALVNALWRELGREPDALDYLERITGGLAGLDSPFIAGMRGATRDGDGRLVLSYERLEGEDLGTILARGPIAVERAIAVLRQLCRGLATAHAAGINHRALGPASVVLVREGPRADAVKILDFGIAGVMGESEPKYSPLLPMTPERLLGFGTHTSEDVYLVGCLGYWMLAGAPPFTADDGDGLRRRHAIEDVAPLRSIARLVPSGIARALEDALVKDPDDRTADLATLELALVEAQRDAGIVTPWDAHLEALSEKARVLGEEPATSGVFQSVSGRGGKRTPSGSHRPVGGNGVAANHSPARTVVAAGPGAREAAATGSAAAPGKMPRPKPVSNVGAKVVRPIVAAPTAEPAKPVEPAPVEAKPVESTPVEAKPLEAKPVIAKPVLKPGEPRIPLPPRTTSTKPAEAKPLAMPAKPVEAKPLAMPAKPVEAKPVEAKPVEAKPVEAKPVEAKPVEAKPVEAKPVEAKPTVIPKPASPARIPPPPKMATRPSSLRTEGPPPPSLLTAKEVAPKEPTPTAETSLVGLSLEDVEALGAGLKLPDPPTIEPPAEPEIEAKADPAIEPPSAPASDDAPTIAIAPAPSPSFEPPVAMPLPLADRTDAEALVVGPEVPPKRPAWLIPGVIGIGLVTVLAFAFSPGSSDAPTPSTPTPTPTATTPTATTPTPVTPTPVTPTPPAPIPEVAVAAPPPTTPPPTIAPTPTPTPTPTDPVAEKPAPAPIDPLRQNLIRGKEARKRGKSDEAIAAYRAALRIDASNRTALRELSRLYFDGGNYENAAKYGKQLVAASNASASDRVALGDAYFKLGRTADAKAQYQKAAASGDATAKRRLAKLGG